MPSAPMMGTPPSEDSDCNDEAEFLPAIPSSPQDTPLTNENVTPSTNENDAPSTNENDAPSTKENDVPLTNGNDAPSISEASIQDGIEAQDNMSDVAASCTNENDALHTSDKDASKFSEKDVPHSSENDAPSTNENDTPSTIKNDATDTNENDAPGTNENHAPGASDNSIQATNQPPDHISDVVSKDNDNLSRNVSPPTSVITTPSRDGVMAVSVINSPIARPKAAAELHPLEPDVIELSDDENYGEIEDYMELGNGHYTCLICSQSIDAIQAMVSHIKTDHLLCRRCKTQCSSIESINEHMNTHPKDIFTPPVQLSRKKQKAAPGNNLLQSIKINTDNHNQEIQDLILSKLSSVKNEDLLTENIRQVQVTCSDKAPSKDKKSFVRSIMALVVKSRKASTRVSPLHEPGRVSCQTVVIRTCKGRTDETPQEDEFDIKWKCLKCADGDLYDLMKMAMHVSMKHNVSVLQIQGQIEYVGPPLTVVVSDEEGENDEHTVSGSSNQVIDLSSQENHSPLKAANNSTEQW